MDIDALARRYDNRAGLELVSYRQVGLPVHRLSLRVLVLEEKPIPPIAEHVLRAVSAGLNEVSEVAGLLGLDEVVAQRAIVSLLHSDDLQISAPAGTRIHELALTPKGVASLKAASTIVPVEEKIKVLLDGLTGEVSADHSFELFRHAQLVDDPVLEIPAVRRARPETEDVPVSAIEALIKGARLRGHAARKLLGVVAIDRREYLMRIDAVALVYRRLDTQDPQIELIVNDHVSEAHSQRFAEIQQESGVKSVVAGLQKGLAERLPDVPPELAGQAEKVTEAPGLLRGMEEAREHQARLVQEIRDAEPDEIERLRAELEVAEARARDAEADLAKLTLRFVGVYEHRSYLDRALDEAMERLLIVSPWIRGAVVNTAFVNRLEAALNRGVEIFIGFGLDDKRDRDRSGQDDAAVGRLEALAKSNSAFHLVRLGDSHSKVLICDRKFAVVTSFNWLSFKGDPNRTFRDERGVFVGMPDYVDQEFERFRSRMSDRRG